MFKQLMFAGLLIGSFGAAFGMNQKEVRRSQWGRRSEQTQRHSPTPLRHQKPQSPKPTKSGSLDTSSHSK